MALQPGPAQAQVVAGHSAWSGRRLACRAGARRLSGSSSPIGGEAAARVAFTAPVCPRNEAGRPRNAVPVPAAGSPASLPTPTLRGFAVAEPDPDHVSPGRRVDHQPHWSMPLRCVVRHPASKLPRCVVSVGSTRIAAGSCMAIVRGRHPAAGTGAESGRLRCVGRECERLREWLTIDAGAGGKRDRRRVQVATPGCEASAPSGGAPGRADRACTGSGGGARGGAAA